MGDKVNVLIDNLRSVLGRLIDLPTSFWIIGLLTVFFLAWFASSLLERRNQTKLRWKSPFLITLCVGALLILALQIDKRFSRQQHAMENLDRKLFRMSDELGNLEMRTRSLDTMGSKAGLSILKMDSFRHDWQRNYLVSERKLNEWTDLATLRVFEPQATAFIAAIDLNFPHLQIVLDTIIPEEKYLTSDFAKAFGCFLAINGEAGKTPWQGSGFGEWVGNYISQNRLLMLKDNAERPFLSFDQQNRATYSKETEIDTSPSPENYNTIFGRFDILVDGEALSFEDDLQYPRTIMGIDGMGEKLFLMIVDGSQPDYSMGLTYSYCAELLKYLGAWNAMACDQGGSSCMYVEQMGGIINRPRDGQERVVYTHFGLKDLSSEGF